MYSVQKCSNANYETESLVLEYYDGMEASGGQARWFGPLAARFGIPQGSLVKPHEHVALMCGYDPRKLDQNDLLGSFELLTKKDKLRSNADKVELEASLALIEKTRLEQKQKAGPLDANDTKLLERCDHAVEVWKKKEASIASREYRLGKLVAEKERVEESGKTWPKDKEAKLDELRKTVKKDQEKSQRAGNDITFSPDKAINLIYGAASKDEKNQIRDTLQQVAGEHFQSLLSEAQMRFTENGKTEIFKAEGMVMCVVHDTARVNKDWKPELNEDGSIKYKALEGEDGKGLIEDTQLHVHGVMPNIAYGEEHGRFGAMLTNFITGRQEEHDAELHAKLIVALREKGFALDAVPLDERGKKDKATIRLTTENITQEDLDSISRRSKAIEDEKKEMAANGETATKAKLLEKTRETKRETNPDELDRRWREHVVDELGLTRAKLGLGMEGKAVRDAIDEKRQARREATKTAEGAKLEDMRIIDEITTTKAYFSETELRRALWQDAAITGDIQSVARRFEQITKASKEFAIQVTDDKRDELNSKLPEKQRVEGAIYISRKALREEAEIVEVVSRLAKDMSSATSATSVAASVAAIEASRAGDGNEFKFRPDQVSAATALLTGGRFGILQAGPGSGKSTALAIFIKEAGKRGENVLMLAPSWKASIGAGQGSGLAKELEEQANRGVIDMPAELLGLVDKKNVGAVSTLQAFVLQKSLQEQVKKGTRVLIDEASLGDLPTMLAALKIVEARGGSMVLVGDPAQLPSVGRGAALRWIAESQPGTVHELTVLTRQKDKHDLEAVQAVKDGDVARGLRILRGERVEQDGSIKTHPELSRIKVVFDDKAKIAEMVKFWKESPKPSVSKQITAFRNVDCESINAAIRKDMVKTGEVDANGVKVKTANGDRVFARGDRIIFTDKIAGEDRNAVAFTSQTATILSVDKVGNDLKFKVNIDDVGERSFTLDRRDPAAIDYGMASTIHKAQGITVKASSTAYDPNLGAEAFLVAISRHQEDYQLVMTKAEAKVFEKTVSKMTHKAKAADLVSDQKLDQVEETKLNQANAMFDKEKIRIDRSKHFDGAKGKLQELFNRQSAIKSIMSGVAALIGTSEQQLAADQVKEKAAAAEAARIERINAEAVAARAVDERTRDFFKAIDSRKWDEARSLGEQGLNLLMSNRGRTPLSTAASKYYGEGKAILGYIKKGIGEEAFKAAWHADKQAGLEMNNERGREAYLRAQGGDIEGVIQIARASALSFTSHTGNSTLHLVAHKATPEEMATLRTKCLEEKGGAVAWTAMMDKPNQQGKTPRQIHSELYPSVGEQIKTKAKAAGAAIFENIAAGVGIETEAAKTAKAQAEAARKAAAREEARRKDAELDARLLKDRSQQIASDLAWARKYRLENNHVMQDLHWKNGVENFFNTREKFDMGERHFSLRDTVLSLILEEAPWKQNASVLLKNGRFVSGMDVIKKALSESTDEINNRLDERGLTPLTIYQKSLDKIDKEMAILEEGDHPLKPRKGADKQLDGKILDINAQQLIFKARENGKNVFYEIPRLGIFGIEDGKKGIEEELGSRGIKITLEGGEATRAEVFVDNKKQSIIRWAGDYLVEATGKQLTAHAAARAASSSLNKTYTQGYGRAI